MSTTLRASLPPSAELELEVPLVAGGADGSLEPAPPGPSAYTRGGQRTFHLVLAALVLVPALALSLPIALVNLLLFRDPRRILFRQERVGLGGRTFRIFKFRTMREAPCAFRSWQEGEDALRVTAFGRFLRNTHLDELPQLLNVLRGEMNLIGPRPEMVEVDAWAVAQVPGFRERNEVRPGITGLAQVTQGYATMCTEAYERKLELDRAYVRRASLALDLVLLGRTVVWMVRGRGWSYHRVVREAGEAREARDESAETPGSPPREGGPSEVLPGSRAA